MVHKPFVYARCINNENSLNLASKWHTTYVNFYSNEIKQAQINSNNLKNTKMNTLIKHQRNKFVQSMIKEVRN
jgi:hypothetical protein